MAYIIVPHDILGIQWIIIVLKLSIQQAGVSPLLQNQIEDLARGKQGDNHPSGENKGRKLVVIGQDCVEPLQVLRNAASNEVILQTYMAILW